MEKNMAAQSKANTVGPANERANARESAARRGAPVLRFISAVTLGLAVFTAISILILRGIHYLRPDLLPWTLKSAVPLILIGIAFASLQFVLPRTRAQILLGLMVSAAFILWGVEQFVPNPAIAAFMDDIVVLLFVLDLSIVIHGHLKPGPHPTGKELPFDEADE
jgi:hypothetical protein